MLRVADMPSAELLVAKIVFWIVWIGFIVSAVDTLQFGPFQGLVEEFFRFVPRFLVALLVLALGFLVGNFLWRATLLASVNAGLPAARLLSGTLRLLVIAIAVVMALEQLGLATTVVLTAFAITFGALMLGLAIAFGLGGQDAARALLEQHVKSQEAARNRRRPAFVTAGAPREHVSSCEWQCSFIPPHSPARIRHRRSRPRRATSSSMVLARAGQRLWQVLPLGPTGYGDSPYQCFSAFAGNPLLISLDLLVDQGLLAESDVRGAYRFDEGTIDFPTVIAHRRALWPRVLDRFDQRRRRLCATGSKASAPRRPAGWTTSRSSWRSRPARAPGVDDVGTRYRTARTGRRRALVGRCAHEIQLHKLTQFLFFEQWQGVRDACHARSIDIMGDLPIFVAHDSADVWARREWFRLEPDGRPTVVAGVPPDYFSASGQLWGNPHYRWDALARTGYAWWVERFRALLDLVDRVRIDHFRGFEASWEVPYGATTAVRGGGRRDQARALFEAVRSGLQTERLPFVAENLGVITPEVEALRERFGLPGMAILQFAFGTDPQAPDFKPHNFPRNRVVYTGTHDNDTTLGWWTGDVGHSTRSSLDIDERARACPSLSRYHRIRSALGLHPRRVGVGRRHGDRPGARPAGPGK